MYNQLLWLEEDFQANERVLQEQGDVGKIQSQGKDILCWMKMTKRMFIFLCQSKKKEIKNEALSKKQCR